MPRVAISPQSLPATDAGLFGPTFTTVDNTNNHKVLYEPGMIILFRNPIAATKAVTLRRHKRGVEGTKVCTIPAMSAASISGIGILADLDLAEWLDHAGTDTGYVYFDVPDALFSVAAIKRK